MKYTILLMALYSSYALSDDRLLFTEEQLKTCEEYSFEIIAYNEMKKDGAPIKTALEIYNGHPHSKELTEANVKEVYAADGAKSGILGGYYQATCLNKVVGFEAPSFESLKSNYAKCESEKTPSEVLNCATEVTAQHSKKINPKAS